MLLNPLEGVAGLATVTQKFFSPLEGSDQAAVDVPLVQPPLQCVNECAQEHGVGFSLVPTLQGPCRLRFPVAIRAGSMAPARRRDKAMPSRQGHQAQSVVFPLSNARCFLEGKPIAD